MLDWISPEIVSFAFFFVLVAAAAVFGGQWGADDWYRALSKPAWTPPDWLFPVAWTVLYLMIAIAGWRVWETDHPDRIVPLAFWFAQLTLNAAWSYIFFGRKQLGLALGELVLLWLTILGFTIYAFQIDQTAAYLFLPYLVWVTFAGALNAAIMIRNPVRER